MAGDTPNKDYLHSLRASLCTDTVPSPVLRSRMLRVKNFISIAPGEKLKERCVHYFLSVFHARVTMYI